MSALAKIHIAKKELDMEDADYRALLKRVTGQESAKGLGWQQLDAVVAEMKRLGFKEKPATTKKDLLGYQKAAIKAVAGKTVIMERSRGMGRSLADHPSAKKARALWISLWQLGAIDNSSEQALEAFAKRQLKCERLVWADQQQMFKLIEALKAIGRRHDWTQDEKGHTGIAALKLLKVQLIIAQCAKLGCERPAYLASMTFEQLTDKAAELGRCIRAGGANR